MLLSLSAWMTATAVSPELQARWGLGSGQVGLLTTTVQLGFVAGTALAALLNLADILPSRVSSRARRAWRRQSNAMLLIVPGYRTALLAGFLTGVVSGRRVSARDEDDLDVVPVCARVSRSAPWWVL